MMMGKRLILEQGEGGGKRTMCGWRRFFDCRSANRGI